MKLITKVFAVAALFGLSGIASAGTAAPQLSLVCSACGSDIIEVAPGDIFTLALVYDFGTDPDGDPLFPTVGGASDFFWDAGILTLLNFEFGPDSGDPIFQVPGDIQAGALIQLGFGNFPALPAMGTAAFLTFQANQTEGAGGMTQVTGMETSGPFGGFPEFDPTYNSATVNVVPVPAAIWMLFGGLSALFGVARRRAIV